MHVCMCVCVCVLPSSLYYVLLDPFCSRTIEFGNPDEEKTLPIHIQVSQNMVHKITN